MTTPPVISGHDSGSVTFADGTRMSYEPGTSGLSNPLGLFPTKGGPRPSHEHYSAAAAYLRAHGVS